MTVFKHELRRGFKTLVIWTAAIAFMLAICVIIFPEMKGDMGNINNMFSSMGSFTEAFGMDKVNFGSFIGFYAVECGNVLGLGGSFFAALIAISMLAKEEKERTAEFLLTHPVSRSRIVSEKLAAVAVQILALNIMVWLTAIGSTAIAGEEIPWKALTLLHLSNLILQLELAGVCFGISAFIRRGSLGIGLGLAALMYFLNIIANISESAGFLKYITPFGYTDGADIVANGSLECVMIAVGVAYTAIGVTAGYLRYCKKDIQ